MSTVALARNAKELPVSRGHEKERQSAHPSLYRALAIVAAGFLAFSLLWFACVQAWHWITRLEEFRAYPGNITLEPVSWLNSAAFRADVGRSDQTGLLGGSTSFFAPDLAGRVAAAYESSPWVLRVISVTKVFPNKLQIRLALRAPYALVSRGGVSVLVDEEGVPLSPQVYRMPEEIAKKPKIILNYEPETKPALGAKWQCEGVAAGIEMMKLVGSDPILRALNVQTVEVRKEPVSSKDAPVCVVLHAGAGTQIRWGLPPSRPPVGNSEVGTRQKLESLSTILRHQGTRLSQLEYIDVRWDRPAVRPNARLGVAGGRRGT
jgi:hypothetical protein